MTPPSSEAFKCSVIGSEKLPSEAGGSDTLCAAIRAAVLKDAPKARTVVEVRVLTPSMLAAMLVVDGKALPEQKFAVMDRNLNPRSIERFAQSIASKVAQATAS